MKGSKRLRALCAGSSQRTCRKCWARSAPAASSRSRGFSSSRWSRVQQFALVAGAETLVVGIPHPQGVEDGGDAGGGHFGVVGQHGGLRREVHLGPGHQVALEVVGVHLHQARQQQVAFAVESPGHGRRARIHGGDAALAHVHAAV